MAEKLRTIKIAVNIAKPGPVVDHQFMGSLGVFPDIRDSPVIGISDIKFFTEFKIDVGDRTISGAVGSSETDDLFKGNAQVVVNTQGCSVLYPGEQGGCQNYFFRSRVQGKFYATIEVIEPRCPELLQGAVKQFRVCKDGGNRESAEEFFIVIKHPAAKIRFEFAHESGENLVLPIPEVEFTEICIEIIEACRDAHGEHAFAHRVLDHVSITPEEARIGVTSDTVNRSQEPDADFSFQERRVGTEGPCYGGAVKIHPLVPVGQRSAQLHVTSRIRGIDQQSVEQVLRINNIVLRYNAQRKNGKYPQKQRNK